MPFQIVRADLTKMKVDAIVNTANPMPVIGAGVDSAIYEAAGEAKLLAKRKKIGVIPVGEAAVTDAFDLNANYIIHTVGPIWQDGNHKERQLLSSCYRNSIELALQYHCESIAFPLISTGVYGFPKWEALQIAIEVFRECLEHSEIDIYLVVYDRESFDLSGRIFQEVDAYIDDHYIVEKKRTAKYQEDSEIQRNRRRQPMEPTDVCESCMSFESAPTPNLAPVPKLEHTSKPKITKKSEMRFENRITSLNKRSLDDVLLGLGETFSESLFRYIDEKGLDEVSVYKKANISRKVFSKIRSNKYYTPSKKTAVAFAIALQLNLDETKDFLSRAGLALSPSDKFDLIVQYFISEGIYDIYSINLALFEHDQQLLGA